MDRKFTSANKTQLTMKERVIEIIKERTGVYLDVHVSHENVYDFNGVLVFVVNQKAKPNTGMIFLTEKSWYIKIGRRGAVYSVPITSDANTKRNKYLIF